MFSQKQLASIIIIAGIIIISITFFAKHKEDFYIDTLVEQRGGSCVLESGYCLHADRNWTGYIIGWTVGVSLLILGLYLFFFDKSYEKFKAQQDAFSKEISQAKKKDEFSAFLAGFSPEEQNILKAIKEQDGIKQSTLRYRTGIGKASLSLLLNSLEKREIINRKASGKTKEVFLKKRF